MSTRLISLSGALNVRDVGGYRTNDGHVTRWHTLLRADSLHALTLDDQQLLLDIGLCTVIDLRHEDEIKEKPDVFADDKRIRYMNIPLFQPGFPIPDNLETLYIDILESAGEPIKQVFDVITIEGGIPALIHCAAGQDRTGIMTALILGALDVPPVTLVEDYALSAVYLKSRHAEQRAKALGEGRDMVRFDALLTPSPHVMRSLIATINQRYGGTRMYLQSIGVHSDQIEFLKSVLVTH